MASSPPREPCRATIDSGELEGTVGPAANGTPVHRFLAVPYAAPPLGELRWRPPQPAAGWEGVRKEPEKLPVCPQLGGAAGREAFDGHVNELTEDCLVLNVWTPTLDRAAKLPVIFYIHGGAGKMGTAMSPRLGGNELAGRGACFVGINYRLGVWGFLAHPALTAEDPNGSSGNYAILDQSAPPPLPASLAVPASHGLRLAAGSRRAGLGSAQHRELWRQPRLRHDLGAVVRSAVRHNAGLLPAGPRTLPPGDGAVLHGHGKRAAPHATI